MPNITYNGVVESFKLSGEKHKGPYSNSTYVPVIRLSIKNESGKSREFELPMNIPNNPFIVDLIERDLRGQKVIYEEKHKKIECAIGPTWRLKVETGNFKGIEYLLEEFTDW